MTLDEALKVLMRENIEDFIYKVRERASDQDQTWPDSFWLHPRVKDFSCACEVIRVHVNRPPLGT